ncbi:MAG: hypothetical protein M3M85_02555 [bacterium]|nr:hypothetical protein [bacterium]
MAKSIDECNRNIQYWMLEMQKATKELKWWQDELQKAQRDAQEEARQRATNPSSRD